MNMRKAVLTLSSNTKGKQADYLRPGKEWTELVRCVR